MWVEGDVISLESELEIVASDELAFLVKKAEKTNDLTLIEELRSYWGGESWESIQAKLKVEGSTWYVWWFDAVKNFLTRHI
jgi:hypothetical protein